LPAGPLSAYTTYTIGATETKGGSSVTPGTLTLSLDNAAIGTISGTTLKTGVKNASGHLTVTDSSHGVSGMAAVTVASTHPGTAGDTASFAGTIVQTVRRPLPAPVATEPPYTYDYAVAVAQTVSSGKSFNGASGLTDFRDVESDTLQSPVATRTTTTDAYYSIVAAGSLLDVLSNGSSASDSNGSTYVTDIGSGNGLIDILPETAGQSWSNNAAETYSETESDSATTRRTVNANGSSTETDTFADPSLSNETITVNSDLTASLDEIGGEDATASVTAPAGGKITYHLMIGGGSYSFPITDWYPTTTLASDSSVEALGVTIPAACKVPAVVGTTATQIVETQANLNPMLGTYETRSTTSFSAPSYGQVCVQISDTIDDYYDYSGQSPNVVQLYSTPEQITTTTETVGVTHASIAGAPSTFARSRALVAAKLSFDRVMGRLYEKRARLRAAALHRYRTATLKGVHR
jgi:hypothetical protein